MGEKKREKEEEARENVSNAVMLYSEVSNSTNHRYTFADAMKQQRKQMQQEQEQINQEDKQIKEEGGNKTANASNAVMLSSGAFSVSQLAAVNETTREKE